MKFFYLILSILFFHQSNLLSQIKRDYVWTIGDNGSSGISHPDFGGVNLNFNTEPVDILRIERIEKSFGSNSSSISDIDGKLMFFTGGCFVYGKNNLLIENGDIINEGEFRNRCITGSSYISGNASTLFLPNPINENEYYLIHQRRDALGSSASATLLFSKLNSAENNGLGMIIEGNIPVLGVRTLLGSMASVKHANGKDWWLIVPEDSTNNYNMLLVDEFGIQNTHDQEIGNEIGFYGIGTGQSKFSPDGTKYARWTSTQQLLIADFDRTTGRFSNEIQIEVQEEGTRGGTEFSPNSRFLYVSTDDYIYQLDLLESDIASSSQVVAEYDGFVDFLPTSFDRMQLTPDCRIFINLPGGHRFWHIIHNPNEKGLACNVEQRGLFLKTWTFNTMPYFPNYNLSALGDSGGYPCDSTKITVSSTDIPINQPTGFVYPNPTKGTIQIDMPPNVGELNFQLFDMAGKPISTKKSILPFEEIQLMDVANGMYFYKVFDRKGNAWSEKVVVNR